MAYTDIGYDEFLNRVDDAPTDQSQELSSQDFDSYVQEISGSKIQGGLISTPDGRVQLDLEGGRFLVNNGVQDLVQLGILPDGSIGLLIKDNDGNILMNVAGNNNYFVSSDKKTKLDLTAGQFTVKDEADIVTVILGKFDA